MQTPNNKLFSFPRLNLRLQGILGGLGSLILLVGMVSLSTVSFENAALLSSDVTTASEDQTIIDQSTTTALPSDTLAQLPNIEQLAPVTGTTGDTIFLVGTNLIQTAGDKLVEFSAPRGTTVRARTVDVAILEGRETLRVVVPEGAVTGPVTLTVEGLKIIAPQSFTVIDGSTAGGSASGVAPQILALSQSSVSAGDQILVTGTGLTQSEPAVRIGGVTAPIANTSKDGTGNDILMITVPADAVSGFLTVDVAGQTAIYQQTVTVANSTATAPQIDASRHRILPAFITEFTDTLSLYTFISDPDGLADIVSVNIDLSAIGGTPSNEMLAGLQEGNGRIYGLEGFFIPDLLESNTEYNLPITATDATGQVARDAFIICAGDCSEPEASAEVTGDADFIEPVAVDLNQPMNLTSRIEQGLLRLDWKMAAESTGVTGYYIYYAETAGEYTHRVPAGTITSFYLEDLTPLKQYFIAVSSVDAAGNESEKSAPITAALPFKTDSEATHAAAPVEPTEMPSFDYSASADIEPVHAAAQPVLSNVGPAETLAVSVGMAILLATGWVLRRKLV